MRPCLIVCRGSDLVGLGGVSGGTGHFLIKIKRIPQGSSRDFLSSSQLEQICTRHFALHVSLRGPVRVQVADVRVQS